MNLQELRALVARGESERLEYKRTTGQRTDAAKTVCAMLNGLGGFVLFGVSPAGEIAGQQVTAKTLEDIAHELQRIEPPAFPDIETVDLGGSLSAIVLRVPGGGGPYTYDGRAYLRHGPITQIIPRTRYERLLLERMHARIAGRISPRWASRSISSTMLRSSARSRKPFAAGALRSPAPATYTPC